MCVIVNGMSNGLGNEWRVRQCIPDFFHLAPGILRGGLDSYKLHREVFYAENAAHAPATQHQDHLEAENYAVEIAQSTTEDKDLVGSGCDIVEKNTRGGKTPAGEREISEKSNKESRRQGEFSRGQGQEENRTRFSDDSNEALHANGKYFYHGEDNIKENRKCEQSNGINENDQKTSEDTSLGIARRNEGQRTPEKSQSDRRSIENNSSEEGIRKHSSAKPGQAGRRQSTYSSNRNITPGRRGSINRSGKIQQKAQGLQGNNGNQKKGWDEKKQGISKEGEGSSRGKTPCEKKTDENDQRQNKNYPRVKPELSEPMKTKGNGAKPNGRLKDQGPKIQKHGVGGKALHDPREENRKFGSTSEVKNVAAVKPATIKENIRSKDLTKERSGSSGEGGDIEAPTGEKSETTSALDKKGSRHGSDRERFQSSSADSIFYKNASRENNCSRLKKDCDILSDLLILPDSPGTFQRRFVEKGSRFFQTISDRFSDSSPLSTDRPKAGSYLIEVEKAWRNFLRRGCSTKVPKKYTKRGTKEGDPGSNPKHRSCCLHFEENGTPEPAPYTPIQENRHTRTMWATTRIRYFDNNSVIYEIFEPSTEGPEKISRRVEEVFVKSYKKNLFEALAEFQEQQVEIDQKLSSIRPENAKIPNGKHDDNDMELMEAEPDDKELLHEDPNKEVDIKENIVYLPAPEESTNKNESSEQLCELYDQTEERNGNHMKSDRENRELFHEDTNEVVDVKEGTSDHIPTPELEESQESTNKNESCRMKIAEIEQGRNEKAESIAKELVNDDLPFSTPQFDPRFPHTNQTKRCFLSFVDFQRCDRLLGDYEGCERLKKCYKSLCPNQWIEKWEDQLEEGTFPVKLPPKQ